MDKIVKKNKKTGETHWPDVYVLMRIYCPDLEKSEAFVDQLTEALSTVVKNKADYDGHVYFLFNDDTVRGDSVEMYSKYRSLLLDKINAFFKEDWRETEKETDDEPGKKGSSYSTYLVRELFLELAQNDDDIAISLDQDDRLKPGAISNIARSMYRGGIVVSPYQMKDPEQLDITDDGGLIHNRLSRMLSCKMNSRRIIRGKVQIPEKKYDKLFRPHGKNERKEQWAIVKKNASLLLERCKCRGWNVYAGSHCISELSSLGWTKSYTKPPLEQFHRELKIMLESRGGVKEYFKGHRSYEDFIDFYMLLFKDIPVIGIKEKSHVYMKNPSSITSSPKVEDFRDQRTSSLITLIDLCYAKQRHEELKKIELETDDFVFADLCENAKFKLQRFVASKVSQIEKIIDQYNTDYYKNGKDAFADFAAKTHRGYFISKLARLALGEKREGLKQDEDLFEDTTSRSDDSAKNFKDLFSEDTFNSNPYYHERVNASSPRYVLRRAVSIEKEKRKQRNKKEENPTKGDLLTGSVTPNQRRLKKLVIIRWICVFFLLAGLAGLVLASPKVASALELEGNKYLSVIDEFQQLLAAFLALFGVIITILSNEIGKVRLLAEDEAATVKLYYSEFHDFIRHLEANVKVMIQIRKEIQDGCYRVQDIHFENLKWPASSSLFSDGMAKLIARDRVDDFARLKVNLRNINNSSHWLQELAHNGGELKEALEWEIARHFGYLVNMYYLDSHEFCFPSPDDIDRYIHENAIKNRITSLFMDYDAPERYKQVDYFIDKYNDDRRMKRSVLVQPVDKVVK